MSILPTSNGGLFCSRIACFLFICFVWPSSTFATLTVKNAQQYRADTGAVIPPAGTIPAGVGVLVDCAPADTTGAKIQMQVELQKLPATWTGNPNHMSSFVASGSRPGISVAAGLAAGNYGWRYRVVNSAGLVGNWVAANNPDFVVQAASTLALPQTAPPPPAPIPVVTKPVYTPATAAAPFISSVSPATLPPVNGNQPLTISGNSFQNGATLSFVPPEGGTINSFAAKLTFVSANQINYQINNLSDVGMWTVRVNNPDGQSSRPVSFMVGTGTKAVASPVTPAPVPVTAQPVYTPATAAAPFISSVSPVTLPPMNGNQPLAINGNNFQNGATLSFVPPEGGTINSFAAKLTFVSANQISYQINNLSDVGNWTVRVKNPDGQLSRPASFTVAAGTQPAPSPATSATIPDTTHPANTPASATASFIKNALSASTQNSVAGFLIFPIRGLSFKTANISSVFDHAMTNAYKAGTRVVAYNGQEGMIKDTSWHAIVGNDQLYGYKKPDGAAFTLPQGNYTGGSTLNYEGHTGYDFPYPHSFEVVAAAEGKVHKWNDDTNQIEIDHKNGFKTFYIHMLPQDTASLVDGATVTQGQHLGYCGNYSKNFQVGFHLHFTVIKGNVRVDPYGWVGAGEDPYYTRFGVRNEVLWIDSLRSLPASSSTIPASNVQNPQFLTLPANVADTRMAGSTPMTGSFVVPPWIKASNIPQALISVLAEVSKTQNLPLKLETYKDLKFGNGGFAVGEYKITPDASIDLGGVAGTLKVIQKVDDAATLYSIYDYAKSEFESRGMTGHSLINAWVSSPQSIVYAFQNPDAGIKALIDGLTSTSAVSIRFASFGLIEVHGPEVEQWVNRMANANPLLQTIPSAQPVSAQQSAPSAYSPQLPVRNVPSNNNPQYPAGPNMYPRSSTPGQTPMMPGVSLVPDKAP